MPKNTDFIGIALLLLLLSNNHYSGLNIHQISRTLSSFELGSIINDLHRLSHIINRLDRLGQVALNMPQISDLEKITPMLSSLLNSEDENQNAIF